MRTFLIRQASGKSVGANELDGLSVGCDHSGVFFLTGALAELRVFATHLQPLQRVQIEASLARRYGLPYSVVRSLPQPARPTLESRFLSCAPRAATRQSSDA